MKGRTASEKIGAFVRSTRDIPDEAVHASARAFLDTIAVAVAGREEPASKVAREYALEDRATGTSSLWGSSDHAKAEDAALVNAIAAHILDYDHVSLPLRGHPSTVLFPALVSLGETIDATGGQVASAFVVGFEVIVKIARAVALEHYSRGWHTTSILGVVAAAAACSHLLGLTTDQTVSALGMAAAHAAGSRRSSGTMTRALQAGHAAATAVRTVRLAARGFTAPRDALDGVFGYLDLYGNGGNLHSELDSLGEKPLELLRTGFEVKRFPCSYATHRALQAVQELQARQPIVVSEIERVRVTTHSGGLTALIHHRPWRGLEGKFSLEYVVAAALLEGSVRLDSFTDAAVQHPVAQALLRRVEGVEEEGDPWPRRALVDIALLNGQQCSSRVVTLRGSAQMPPADAELEAKFHECLAFSRSEVDGDGFLAMLWPWRDQPIRGIMGCLEPLGAEPRVEPRANCLPVRSVLL